MRPSILAAGVAATAVVLAIAAAAATGAQGTTAPSGTLELVLPVEATRMRFIDNQPRGRPSPGDMLVGTGRLTDAAGARAGSIQAVFVGTVGDIRAQATATLMLAGGDIVIEGLADDTREPEVLVIAGGTGQYAGAHGTVAVTETRNQTRFLLTFMP